jgi:hypothetical protein
VGNTTAPNGSSGKVRIGRSDEAWRLVLSTLVRYEIIEVYMDEPTPTELTSPPAYTPTALKSVEELRSTVTPVLPNLTRTRSERGLRDSHLKRLTQWLHQ